MSARDLLLKQFLKSGLTTDRQKFTHLRNKVTQTLRLAKANFFINLIQNSKGNGKLVWQNLNKLLCLQSKSNKKIELQINNSIIKDPALIATNFNDFFINSVKEITQHFAPPAYTENVSDPDQSLFTITEISDYEVGKIIASLKVSKALDVFGLHTIFF